MSLLSKLFGGGGKTTRDPEIYNDFRITPTPQSAPGGFRLSARIEKDIAGDVKVHHMVRADICPGADEAESFSIRKAKQLIDEQGDAIFR